jgi:hypothetical protein
MKFKDNIDIIFMDFAKELGKSGFLKEHATIKDILDCGDRLKSTAGFLDFAHYHLCFCQRKIEK